MRKLGIFLIFLLTVPATAVAEDGRFFWGVMLGSTDFDIDGSDQIFVTTAQGRGGWDFLSWLGFEGRVLTSDSKSAAGVDDFNIRYMGSAYVKLSLPPKRNARAKFYVLGGYSGGRLEFEVAGVDDPWSTRAPWSRPTAASSSSKTSTACLCRPRSDSTRSSSAAAISALARYGTSGST